MKNCLTLEDIDDLRPCPERGVVVRAALRKLEGVTCYSAADARAAGCSFDDVLWAARRVAANDPDILRRLLYFATDCAVLAFDARRPVAGRDRHVIAVARAAIDDPAARAEAARTWATKMWMGDAGAVALGAAARASRAADAAAWAVDAVTAARVRSAPLTAMYDRLVYWLTDAEPQPMEIENA